MLKTRNCRLGFLAGISLLAGANRPAAAATLLTDPFTAFNTVTTWQPLPITTVSGSTPGYFGLPQTVTPTTISGRSAETFDSSFNSNNQYTGFESQAVFNGLLTANLGVNFYTSGGIDEVLGVGLVGSSGSISLNLFAGNFGSTRVVAIDNSGSINSGTTAGPNDWQFSTFYNFVISASATSSVLSLESDSGTDLFTNTVNQGLSSLGSNIRVELEQGVNSPGSPRQSIASIDGLVLTGTSVPEPVSGAFLLSAGLLALPRRRRIAHS